MDSNDEVSAQGYPTDVDAQCHGRDDETDDAKDCDCFWEVIDTHGEEGTATDARGKDHYHDNDARALCVCVCTCACACVYVYVCECLRVFY